MAQANINISCRENREDNDDGLRTALLSLRPVLKKLGLVPSRLGPYIPRDDTLETWQQTAYGHLRKVIQEVVKQHETKKELELAVLMFVDEVLSPTAPPGVMSCLMRLLILANSRSDRQNEEAWCVHDVLRLCSFYMPLQEVLVRKISDKQGMERVLNQLLQKSILKHDEMLEVLNTLNQDPNCIQPAIAHMLSYVYSGARFNFFPRLNLQNSNEEPTPPPTWLKNLLQCVECCDHQGCQNIEQNVPPGLLSGDTWIAACEKLVSGRQYRTRENGADDTVSESGESDISNFTMRQGENYSNHHQKNYFTDQKCLGPNISGQTLEETKHNRTALFVYGTSSVEIIQHPTQQYQPQEGAAGELRQNSAALQSVSVAEVSSVSTENNLHVQLPVVNPAISETMPVRIDPEIRDLSRTLYYTGLADGPETGQKEISLKSYQEELLPEARNGKSVAIFLPTGTGKTFIVLKYVQEYLRSPGPHKPVVFLAPKVKLVEQQYKRFNYFFPDVTYLRTGRSRSNNAPFSELLTLYKVFVMTPMCLVETVRRAGVQLNDFSLMVLDECHHTHGRKDFKILMDLYMDAKFALLSESNNPSSGMPQVIGLTASPGVGKGRTLDEAVQHIRELCFSMNVEKICTVKKQKAELQLSINEPKHEIHKCENRKKDNFRQIIEAMMKTIEDKMISSQYVAQHEDPVVQEQLRIILTAPDLHRATLRYTLWACSLDTKLNFVAEDNKDVFTMFFSCAEMLQRYQTCLILNEDCESCYALDYLLEQERQMDEVEPLEKTDKELLDHFREHKLELERASRDPEDFNPKLQVLESILLTMIDKNENDCACMVFVRTIELSLAMQRWIQGHRDLKCLKPGRVIGERRGGMTGKQLSDVMDKFNQGDHKVLICTSVAEEGHDFQACNVVIRYDFITTMISMIQTRGRARRMDSQYCIVGDQTRSSIDKHKGNLASEQLMIKAIVEAQNQINANENEFLHDMRNWQTYEWNKRKAAADRAKLKRRLLDSSAPAYRLLCRKCQCDACMSTDLRLYGPSNRLVIAEDFQDRWRRVERRGKANEHYQHNLEKIAKVHCKGCNLDWGSLIKHLPSKGEFPVLKLESFCLLDTSTSKKRVEKIKWEYAPFNVEEITEEELEEVAEKRLISQGV